MKILLSGAVREREILNHTHVFISHRCGLTPLPLCDTTNVQEWVRPTWIYCTWALQVVP
jgi:hypothetical protein